MLGRRYLLALLLLLTACASPQAIPSYCVPEAIYTGWIWRHDTRQEVRIIEQHTRPGFAHCQAEALQGDKWIPLTIVWTGERIGVTTYQRHFDIEPFRVRTIQDFVADQIRWIR
jgi:hypothetical protein